MRIAIDGRSFSHPQPGGFKTYTTNLIRALSQINNTNHYLIYLDRRLETLYKFPFNWSVRIIPSYWGSLGMPLREQFLLPQALKRDRPDIIHFPAATGSLFTPFTRVITLHDAIEFIEKPVLSNLSPKNLKRLIMNQYYQHIQRQLSIKASVIITGSKHSKSDLTRFLGISSDKIRVIPDAQADHFIPILDKQQIRVSLRDINLPKKFILAIASASPRKNAWGLLRIYAQLPYELRQQFHLVIIWTHDRLQVDIAKYIKKLELGQFVKFIARVSDEQLVALYNSATVFIYPSLYEGFGLPVLEAMACGTPVVASNLTSIPEVAGDAAILEDPREEARFAKAMERLLLNYDEQQFYAEKGLFHARGFSWQRTAKMTLDVYQEVTSCH